MTFANKLVGMKLSILCIDHANGTCNICFRDIIVDAQFNTFFHIVNCLI